MVFNLEDSLSENGSGRNTIYTFICSNKTCNDIFEVRKDNIYTRKTTLCQKCSRLMNLEKVNIHQKYWHNYTKLLAVSNRKNIVMDLSFEEFSELAKNENCVYCDKYIDWSLRRYNLDRKDNNIGYIKDNLVVCCWKCNRVKSNEYTYDEFIQFKPIITELHKNN